MAHFYFVQKTKQNADNMEMQPCICVFKEIYYFL